jgi:5-methylcytosine-specific restriction endonuclease McrA
MPIAAENRALYPKCWPKIRAAVRARAGDRCEGCGIKNHALVERGEPEEEMGVVRTVRIVCTTAHLDHDPHSNDGFEVTFWVKPLTHSNLRFLCQRCHNRHDAKHRTASRARTLDRKRGQGLLFQETKP